MSTAASTNVVSNDAVIVARDRWFVLAVLTLVYAINIADRFVLSTLIEPIKHEFALNDREVGILTGAALAIFYIAAGIPLGALADRTSRKRMIVWALTLWSGFTALCGLTQSFWQLLVARILVGIGEAGGTPPSQSMLADKFLPRARGYAMSIFALGASLGAALGSTLGGALNDAYGWRTVLLVFGALGLPLAALVLFAVREPKRGASDQQAAPSSSSLREGLRFMAGQRALLHVFAGSAVLTFWGWGLVWWTPAFLVRAGFSVADAGAELGAMHGIGGTAVMLATAFAMARVADRDPRHPAWLVAGSTLVATVPAFIAYVAADRGVILAMLWIFVPITYLYIGPVLAMTQNLVPATMRAQACAIVLFVANLANLAIAPIVIGAASDWLAPQLADPSTSLAYVLAASSFTGVWAAWHFFAAARGLRGAATNPNRSVPV